ncbi:MAG: hypothetical protein ACK4YP_25555 [Myxococcota bacterium]
MLLLLALACAPDKDETTDRTGRPGDTDTGPDDTGPDDTGPDDTGDTDTPPGDGCRATPAAADRDRVVLVALPYDEDGGRSEVWAVLTLSTEGELTDDGTRIEMGRAYAGKVAFTPDGSLALAATEDGALAVYDVANGAVVEAAWDGGFYANTVVSDPSGEVAWVVDGNWANNGGGLWRVDLDCATGAPSNAERVLEAKLPEKLLWADGGALLVGREVPGAAAGDDLARLDWTDPPAFTDGVDAFGDDDAVVSDAAVVGEWVVLGDISEFSGIPTRVARVRLGDELVAEEPVDIEDPISLVAFPDGSARALVASGYGDAYVVLDVAEGSTSPVSASGVQLPGSMVAVTRGSLDGLVLGAEVGGIRLLQLDGEGAWDGGVFAFGSGIDHIPCVLGVAP